MRRKARTSEGAGDPGWESIKVPRRLIEDVKKTRAKLLKVGLDGLPPGLAGAIRLEGASGRPLKRIGIGQVLVLADKTLNHLLDG